MQNKVQPSIYKSLFLEWIKQQGTLQEKFTLFKQKLYKRCSMKIVFDNQSALQLLNLIKSNQLFGKQLNQFQQIERNAKMILQIAQKLYQKQFIRKKQVIQIQNQLNTKINQRINLKVRNSPIKSKIQQLIPRKSKNMKEQTKSSINKILLTAVKRRVLECESKQYILIQQQVNHVKKQLKNKFQQIQDLQYYGSLRSGFCIKSASDVDLNTKFKTKEIMTRKQQARWLWKFNDFFKQSPLYRPFNLCDNKNKKPKVQCLTLNNKINEGVKKIDIVINNSHGVDNSSLLGKFCDASSSVRDFGILVKLWGNKHKLVDKTKLSSYGIILMMLHFLMETQQIPYLPADKESLLNLPIKIIQQKIQPLYDNFKSFLNYYGENGIFHQKIKCVKITKSPHYNQSQDILYNMVDPLDYSNPGRMSIKMKNNMFGTIKSTLETLDSHNDDLIYQLFAYKSQN